MKLPLTIAILFSLCVCMGCEPKIPQAGYSVRISSFHRLNVEWYAVGSSEKMQTGLPDRTSASAYGTHAAIMITNILDPNMDSLGYPVPSLYLDSLFIYEEVDGQSELIYSGIEDDDWSLVPQEKRERHLFTYVLSL